MHTQNQQQSQQQKQGQEPARTTRKAWGRASTVTRDELQFATVSNARSAEGNMSSVVRVPESLYQDAKEAAVLFSRSASGQLEHWARLGQAVEASPDLSTIQVAKLLCTLVEGKLPEHPHMPAVRYEVAVEKLGTRIAAINADLDQAEDGGDEVKQRALMDRLTYLVRLQRGLRLADKETIMLILDGKLPDDGQALFD